MAAKREILKTILIEEFGELTNEAMHRKLNTMAMEKHKPYIFSMLEKAGYAKMSYSRAYAKIVSVSDGD